MKKKEVTKKNATKAVQPKKEKSYDVNFLGVKLNCLKSWLYDRATFNWILSFYFFTSFSFIILFVLSIIDIIFKMNIFGFEH